MPENPFSCKHFTILEEKDKSVQTKQDHLIMISELRQAKRADDYLPIRVTVQSKTTGKRVAGPFSSRIINISKTGACLLMTQVMCDRFHVFHSTRENDSLFLQLLVSLPPDIPGTTLSAQPVWLDIFRQGEIRAFKMGVDFHRTAEKEEIQELLTAMTRKQKIRASWWKSHTGQYLARHTMRAARLLTVNLFPGR